ncbi:unnamed protein product, partial [Symbiodinium sp. CCMP2592]
FSSDIPMLDQSRLDIQNELDERVIRFMYDVSYDFCWTLRWLRADLPTWAAILCCATHSHWRAFDMTRQLVQYGVRVAFKSKDWD